MIRTILPVELNRSSEMNVIDVREFGGGAIRGAKLVPLATVPTESARWNQMIVKSWYAKAASVACRPREKMLAAGFSHVAVLDRGMEAWAAAGFPMQTSQNRPWSLER